MHIHDILMKHLISILSGFLFFGLILSAQPLGVLMDELDKVIAEKESYSVNKEQRLSEMKAAVVGLTGKELSDAYESLYREYANYDVDSAFTYCRKMLSYSETFGLKNEYEDGLMNMADLYTATGMYAEAQEILETGQFSDRTMYYHCMHSLYTGMMQNATFEDDREKYSLLRSQARDSLLNGLTPSGMDYIYTMSEKLSEQGDYAEAIALISNYYNRPFVTDRNRAILDYSLAVAWRGAGDVEKAKWYYAKGAIADLKTPVRDYRSLLELALLLYREGDVQRAFRYMLCSMEDLQESNTRIRTMEFIPVMTLVSDSYQKELSDKTRLLYITLGLLSVIVILLILAAVLLYIQRNKTNAAKKKLEDSYVALKELNDIKEEYLFMYMEQISDYIDRMEGLHRKLLMTWRKYGPDRLAEELERPTNVDQALKNFYDGFDATFLHLFPTFVDEVNALLKPEEHLTLKRGNRMSTELRMLALFRLGVTDSAKVGHFLRCSTATVYNYRAKLRKAAIEPDSFDKAITDKQ